MSIMSVSSSSFGVADVLVFAASLVISIGIGIYYAVKDGRKKTVENYYYGDRKMSPISVGISISVSFISAVTVLGYPAESYLYGTVSLWYCLQMVIPNTIACLYYIPLIHELKLATIYQYLELRFSVFTRKVAAGVEIINTLLYMGSTMYLPALALNAVTPLSLEWSIVITSVVCTLYTAFGGMKAVVWTDVVQAFIMLSGSLVAFIRPIIIVGGFDNVYRALERGERLNMFNFNPDPRMRSTFWTVMIGTSIGQTTLACCTQSIAQRYSSCKSVNDARKAALISLIPKVILSLFTLLTGCVAYAYYEGCDPLMSGWIRKADQIIPYLVTDVFADVPGMAGLFVAAAYSGTMSSVSSGINAVSSLILQDFILPSRPNMKEPTKMLLGLLIALLVGACSTGLAFAAAATTDTVLSLVMKIRGTFGGPIVGLFTLGIFFPWTNTKGALTGLVTGVAVTMWIAIGSLLEGRDPATSGKLPLSVDACDANTTVAPILDEQFTSTTARNIFEETKTYSPVYAVSYMYYSAIGISITVVVGIIASLLTKPNNPEQMKPELFRPLIGSCCGVSWFRCGVPNPPEEERAEEKVALHKI